MIDLMNEHDEDDNTLFNAVMSGFAKNYISKRSDCTSPQLVTQTTKIKVLSLNLGLS